jgi:hypothetical protein
MVVDWLGGAIAHLLGLSGRLGASVALAAGALYLLRARAVEPFTTIPPEWANGIFIAGLWGAALAAVSFVAWLAEVFQRWFSAWNAAWKARAIQAERRERGVGHLWTGPAEFRTTVAFLYLNGVRQFSAHRRNTLLNDLIEAGILETDDLPGSEYTRSARYVIPNRIWTSLNANEALLKTLPVSKEPPWKDFDPGIRI